MSVKDNSHGCQVTIDFNHYKVHAGEMFSATYSATITAGANQDIMIVTGANDPHVNFNIAVTGQGLFSIYEGITSSANGTTLTVYNMNRNSANSCTLVMFSGPTWSTNSEKLIYRAIMPGGASPTTRVGGVTRPGTEWELLPSTKYLVRIANESGSTNTSSVNIEFYED